ncbi:MAG: diacylglycerol/lipid kinase family protein [Rhodopila sp.]
MNSYLAQHGLNAEIWPLNGGAQVADAVAQGVRQGYGTIVVGGGDGTLSAGAACLAGSDCPMDVLPMGTFNYFARSLGIPADIKAAVNVLAHGQERGMSLGDVNGQIFLNNASLGVYARILERRENFYQRWGRSRAAAGPPPMSRSCSPSFAPVRRFHCRSPWMA